MSFKIKSLILIIFFIKIVYTEEISTQNLFVSNSSIINKNDPFLSNSFDISKKDDALNTYIENILETIRKPASKNTFENLEVEYVNFFSQPKKNWTILVYIAGDNNLYKFAIRNIEQLKQLGSNDKLNIVIHFDFHQSLKPKETRRFYIQKGKLIQIGKYPAMDSGSEKTLIDATTWAIQNFPSEYFGLVLWNHGSGDIHPSFSRHLIDPSDMFTYNPNTEQIELDRSISFIDFLQSKNKERGICFDDTTGNFLDDNKIITALKKTYELRGNKKIDVLMMDACLMAGIGTMSLIAPYAEFATASQEVVLGPGYNYTAMLKPLSIYNMTPYPFANHIVETYYTTYGPITPDFTESAIDLFYVRGMMENIKSFTETALSFMSQDPTSSIKKILMLSGNPDLCTHFEEPSYIDLKHFYENVLSHGIKIKVTNSEGKDFYTEISKIIKDGLNTFKKLILKNVCGRNYARANGISIYFPQRYISPTFQTTFFAKNNPWIKLLNKLLY